MKQFYVYTHLRPDLTPFYVGKGLLPRTTDFTGRSAWHKNIVSKHGRENVIVERFPCSSEAEAFYREVTIIRELRRNGAVLCNITDGGEGTSGSKKTARERLAVSRAQKGRVRTEAEKNKLRAKALTQMTNPANVEKSREGARSQMAVPEIKERSLAGLRRLHTDEAFHKRISDRQKGCKAITDGMEVRRVKVTEDFEMPEGWRFGINYTPGKKK